MSISRWLRVLYPILLLAISGVILFTELYHGQIPFIFWLVPVLIFAVTLGIHTFNYSVYKDGGKFTTESSIVIREKESYVTNYDTFDFTATQFYINRGKGRWYGFYCADFILEKDSLSVLGYKNLTAITTYLMPFRLLKESSGRHYEYKIVSHAVLPGNRCEISFLDPDYAEPLRLVVKSSHEITAWLKAG